MTSAKQNLIEAEKKALELFEGIELKGLITHGKTEHQLNTEIFKLADDLFGIKKYWHKRIVRTGKNTLTPYKENPPDLLIEKDDILFFDFGPIFEEWEADFGRTYVIGNNPYKLKLKKDIETAWYETKDWFNKQNKLTGAQLFDFTKTLATKYNWILGGEIAGHIIGKFPHEKLDGENFDNYVHPNNHKNMFAPDKNGNPREWILEIHFIDNEKQIGGFFEQLLT